MHQIYKMITIINHLEIKNKIMETIAIILYGAACFAAGMYVTTQISSWIDSRIQHKKFLKNLEEWDKKDEEQRG